MAQPILYCKLCGEPIFTTQNSFWVVKPYGNWHFKCFFKDCHYSRLPALLSGITNILLLLLLTAPAFGQVLPTMKCGQMNPGLGDAARWHATCSTTENNYNPHWTVTVGEELYADGQGMVFQFPLGKAWRKVTLTLWDGHPITMSAFARWNPKTNKAEFQGGIP